MSEQASTTSKPESTSHPDWLTLLVCPVDKSKLRREGETLVCQQCQRVYPIEHGIPNMLVDEEA